jgi:hypothetical protein
MQNQNITLDGTGKATVKATCPAEAFEFYSGAHSFTFQFGLRGDEIPQGGNQTPGMATGDAAAAEVLGTTEWKFIAETSRNKPWAVNDIVGYLVGTAADVIVCRPRRPGGS